VNLRYLVPALGILAFTATVAKAEDAPKPPSVTFTGWSDNILSVQTNADNDAYPIGANKPTDTVVRFEAAASLKADWKVSDKAAAHLNLWFYPEFSGNTGSTSIQYGASPTPGGLNNNNFRLREAYVNWTLTDTLSWEIGKFINPIGVIAQEPTGLLTINNSLIGYLSTYGNDLIGTIVNWAPKGPFSASISVNNGYFTGDDAISPGYAAGSSPYRQNYDMGYGFHATYTFLGDSGSNANLDVAYDPHSDQTALDFSALGTLAGPGVATGALGGSALLLSLSTVVKPTKAWNLEAEIQNLSFAKGNSATVGGVTYNPDNKISRTQGLILANYAIPNAPWGASVTGEAQYIVVHQNEPAGFYIPDQRSLGLQLAIETNPLGSSNFGLNGEIGYDVIKNPFSVTAAAPGAAGYVPSKHTGEAAVEALISF
jgi:hypothetical protein